MIDFRRHAGGMRHAFTLIETLVAIFAIGMLLALLVPAVQMAREAARRASCASNLRQLALGLNNYCASQGVYPQGNSQRNYSIHVALLSHLERGNLYNSINFQFDSHFPATANITASISSPSLLLCPSDVAPPFAREVLRWTSYAGNSGIGVQKYGYNGAFATSFDPPIGPAKVVDGLSETVAMSEWSLGPGDFKSRDPIRATFHTPHRLAEPEEFGEFIGACRDLDTNRADVSPHFKGMSWMYGEFGYTLYNHTQQPNGKTCLNGTGYQIGAWTAGSQHPGGAYSAFLDGHVKFVRSPINVALWHALASRNGREVIGRSFDQ
jgi:prepilin-type processing-associated H-X9-DG protein